MKENTSCRSVNQSSRDSKKAGSEITLPTLHFIQRIYRIEDQTRQTAAPPARIAAERRAKTEAGQVA